ncbi:DUF5058 family protein [Miniphocaeibacter halophilus]|uniref:DUF5058 family protein n=1 Tax=Miniphocaeibacter halophilus TaxID=2931922 RepID=A0AC61MU51_9FIRM|nr:DUF5058 family protein [Miniphocaeibacter halophilus]QQK06908.1 DUF5058 family protein [Miniphocaeibacter halophilus]
MKDYLKIANSPLLFVLCFITVGFVMIQAILFMRKAWKQGIKLGMSKEIMKKTIRSSSIFSIIPSLPILLVLVVLMPNLGKFFPWLRLSVIGSGPYENMAANATAQAFGLQSISSSGFTAEIFVSTMFVMTIGIIWGPLYTMLGSKYIQKGMNLIKGKQEKNYKDIFAVMFISLLCVFGGTYFASPFKVSQTGIVGIVPLLVVITSALFIWLFDYIVLKTKIKILQELAFPLCLIIGMGSAILFTLILS